MCIAHIYLTICTILYAANILKLKNKYCLVQCKNAVLVSIFFIVADALLPLICLSFVVCLFSVLFVCIFCFIFCFCFWVLIFLHISLASALFFASSLKYLTLYLRMSFGLVQFSLTSLDSSKTA